MDSEPLEQVLKQPERGYEALREAYFLGRDRASLFLTAKGKKPGTILELVSMVGDKDGADEMAEEVEECRSILEDLDLPYHEDESTDEDDGATMTLQRHLFIVGKDEDSFRELLDAEHADSCDYASFGRRLGRALGYPETAVEADATKTTLHPNQYPSEIFTDPAWPFCVFAFSREHWREEMEFVREQANFINQEDPKLYEAITHS